MLLAAASVVLGGVSAVLIGLSVVVYRRWERSGTTPLAVFLFLFGVSGFVALTPWAFGLAPTSGDSASIASTLAARTYSWVGMVALLIWSGFALRYVGFGDDVVSTPFQASLLMLPLVAYYGAILVGPVVRSNGGSVGPVLGAAIPVIGVVTFLYWTLMVVSGLFALLRATRRYDYLSNEVGASLVGAALGSVLVVVGGVQIFGTWYGTTIFAATYAVVAALVGLALFRYEALDASPAVVTLGRDEVLEDLQEAVVVVDDEGELVDLNPTARRELVGEDPLGDSLSETIGVDLEGVRELDTVELVTDDGHRLFAPQVSTLTDTGEEVVGYAIALRDVTRRAIREQRLAVLNRVLRHNLRNKLTVVRGVADVAIAGERPPDSMAESLGEATDDLIRIGEKAREIERLLDDAGAEATPVDLREVTHSTVGRYRDRYPGVTFENEVPSDLSVETDPEVLRCVLSNLVENAAQHNDADDPQVRVSADRTGTAHCPVRIRVSDNGPGIPEHERTVIEAGEETPLEHGSGLGLWAVSWGVKRLGGEVAFPETSDGTTVEVRLPAATPVTGGHSPVASEG